jgi:opacity protein-like surface antigen
MRFSHVIAIPAVVAAAVVGLSASVASAQGFGGGSFYVKGFGGLTVPQEDDFALDERFGTASSDTGLDFSNGYVLGIAGGYEMTPNFAVELEYAYRSADADFTRDIQTADNRTTESNAFMVNALYNFTPHGPWQPYVGGGLGVADLNVEQIPTAAGGDFDSDYNFAYQLIGGVGYELPSGWTLNGEARFFGINDQDLENDDLQFRTNYQTFDLLFGATYRF